MKKQKYIKIGNHIFENHINSKAIEALASGSYLKHDEKKCKKFLASKSPREKDSIEECNRKCEELAASLHGPNL